MNVLEEKFGKRLKKGVLLKKYTSFKIGGEAKYFLEVRSTEELVWANEWARSQRIGYDLLGGGSNVLVSDKGFCGLVVRMLDVRCEMLADRTILAGAGLSLRRLSEFASEKGLTGLEWAGGIPGTVGGAIVMNAGCFGREMKDCVVKVRYFDTRNKEIKKLRNKGESMKEVFELTRGQCQFGYRESVFRKQPERIVLEAELGLKRGDKKKIKRQMEEYLKMRNERLPFEYPSAGSIFKKYEIKRDEKLNERLERILKKEQPEFLRGHYIPAGWLIEELGLKGRQIGGAMISERHGNFIVNTGKATAEQVIMLISLIKQKVRNHFGIQLQEEVIFLGFG